jgi:hypothetical protein
MISTGAQAIAAAVSGCPSLCWLNLAGNQIGDIGAMGLAAGVDSTLNIEQLLLNIEDK